MSVEIMIPDVNGVIMEMKQNILSGEFDDRKKNVLKSIQSELID